MRVIDGREMCFNRNPSVGVYCTTKITTDDTRDSALALQTLAMEHSTILTFNALSTREDGATGSAGGEERTMTEEDRCSTLETGWMTGMP